MCRDTASSRIPFLSFIRGFLLHIDRAITAVLAGFMADVFGWKEGGAWPTLEDIFTSIDLSASSGHHLGGLSTRLVGNCGTQLGHCAREAPLIHDAEILPRLLL